MFHQYCAAGLAELSGDNISNVGIFKRFEPIYVAGHRMCKTRLKMMVSCGRRTHTTQLHPTGHDRDDDVDREEDDDDKDLYIIGAVCLSVCHVFAYFPVCV